MNGLRAVAEPAALAIRAQGHDLRSDRERHLFTRRPHDFRAAVRKARIEEARDSVAALAGTTPPSVVFTSGGSEANALALRGAIAGAAWEEDRIARLFVSTTEHESVRANALALAEAVPGLKLTEIPVTGHGTVDLSALRLHLI